MLRLFIARVTLFSKLAAGRNLVWRKKIVEVFSMEFLFKTIKRKEFSSVRGSLLLLFFSVYVDQPPLENTGFPHLIRSVGDFSNRAEDRVEQRLRSKLESRDCEYPKETVEELIKSLVESLRTRSESFASGVESQVSRNINDCKSKKEIRVGDIPEDLLQPLEFTSKLLDLHAFGLLGLTGLYQPILKTCFILFEYNEEYPAQFEFIQKIKKLHLKILASTFGRQRKPAREKVRFGGVFEEVSVPSLLMGNYYSLKNEVHKKMEGELESSAGNHAAARKTVLQVFNIFADMRQNFLLDNFTCWVRSLVREFAGKPFSPEMETEIFEACNQAVLRVFPPILKTGVRSIDDRNGRTSDSFSRFVGEDSAEIYDLGYLLLHAPSPSPHKSLSYFETILPSLICSVLTTEDEGMGIELISIIFRLFSQREEMCEYLERCFVITDEWQQSLHEKIMDINVQLAGHADKAKVGWE